MHRPPVCAALGQAAAPSCARQPKSCLRWVRSRRGFRRRWRLRGRLLSTPIPGPADDLEVRGSGDHLGIDLCGRSHDESVGPAERIQQHPAVPRQRHPRHHRSTPVRRHRSQRSSRQPRHVASRSNLHCEARIIPHNFPIGIAQQPPQPDPTPNLARWAGQLGSVHHHQPRRWRPPSSPGSASGWPAGVVAPT